jgi:hypothetical protein
MRARGRRSYNGPMDTTDAPTAHFAIAGALLDALADHDFDRLAAAFEAEARLSALLPRGFVEWQGAAEIRAAFERWFGDVTEYELVDATVGDVGDLLQLRWRLRVNGERFGGVAQVVEQHAYASAGPAGRIGRISLLCSGFWPEHRGGA